MISNIIFLLLGIGACKLTSKKEKISEEKIVENFIESKYEKIEKLYIATRDVDNIKILKNYFNKYYSKTPTRIYIVNKLLDSLKSFEIFLCLHLGDEMFDEDDVDFYDRLRQSIMDLDLKIDEYLNDFDNMSNLDIINRLKIDITKAIQNNISNN